MSKVELPATWQETENKMREVELALSQIKLHLKENYLSRAEFAEITRRRIKLVQYRNVLVDHFRRQKEEQKKINIEQSKEDNRHRLTIDDEKMKLFYDLYKLSEKNIDRTKLSQDEFLTMMECQTLFEQNNDQ